MDEMRRITIDLPERTLDRLRDVADRERRSPRDQAAVLVERALRTKPPVERSS